MVVADGKLGIHADENLRHRPQRDRRQDGADDEALVESAHDVLARAQADEEGGDDRGDDAHAADQQRIEHHRAGDRRPAEEDRGQDHGGDDGDDIGLEQIGRHAGAVADIVADVVRDHRGIARVVLGDARLDLADEVGADVRALGEDAAAETREDRDQRGAEAERHQRIDQGAAARPLAQQEAVVAGDRQQGEAGDEHARHRSRFERDRQPLGQALARRLGRADVGADGDVHADIARRARQDRADQVTDGHMPAEQEVQHHGDHDADDADRRVLPVEIGAGAFLDGGRDRLHAFVARAGAKNGAARENAVSHCQ